MTTDRLAVVLLLLLLAGAWLLRRRAAGTRLAAAATAVLAVFLCVRWARVGHPPVFGKFETGLAETMVLLALGLWLARRKGERFSRGAVVVAALTLAHTFLLRSEATPLTISERSLWIDLHAVLAWLAWAFLFHALFEAFEPSDEGELGLRLLGWGFVAQTAMAFVGVYYSTLLFANAWSWDPVQTLGLLSWILFGIALHFRLFFGVTLRRQRYFLLVAVLVYVASGKLPMLLRSGQSFHVFELGAMAGEGPR